MKIVIEKSKRKLTVFDAANNVLMTSRVIINKTETPEGKFYISKVILNPGWMPTTNICRKTGLCDYVKPRDKRNPMGDVKIQVSGPIYMHYTNKPHLFDDPKAQSMGCIRTESIHKLVELLVGVKRDDYGVKTQTLKFDKVEVVIQ